MSSNSQTECKRCCTNLIPSGIKTTKQQRQPEVTQRGAHPDEEQQH